MTVIGNRARASEEGAPNTELLPRAEQVPFGPPKQFVSHLEGCGGST